MSSDHYHARVYKVVRLVIDARSAWVVVSESLRNDDTWDVIRHCITRQGAFDYVEEVTARNAELARLEGCNA